MCCVLFHSIVVRFLPIAKVFCCTLELAPIPALLVFFSIMTRKESLSIHILDHFGNKLHCISLILNKRAYVTSADLCCYHVCKTSSSTTFSLFHFNVKRYVNGLQEQWHNINSKHAPNSMVDRWYHQLDFVVFVFRFTLIYAGIA